MITRRHLRVKVLQGLYASVKNREVDLDRSLAFLQQSVQNTYLLYLLLMRFFAELHLLAEERSKSVGKRHLETDSREFPDPLLKNRLLAKIRSNTLLNELWNNKKINQWYLHEDYVRQVYKDLQESKIYTEYRTLEAAGFQEDRDFVVDLFREIIAPNDKIYEFLTDEQLTWTDDIPLVNTYVVKLLKKTEEDTAEAPFAPELINDKEDWEFSKKLLETTLLRYDELEGELEGRTPNWDKERLADLDALMLKMALCEFLYFPSIPEKVTINEYLEIAKEYSTQKSSLFINGILDKMVKTYREEGKLQKTGRGLL
jgi:N utilization substance protein B